MQHALLLDWWHSCQLFHLFKRCTVFSVSSRVLLCFFWHSTVFLLSLYYREFLCTFVLLCFLVKCNTVFDILQQQAWETLNSKAKHSTPLQFCKTHKTSALQQNFFSSLEVINEENKKHGSDCDDVDKNSFAWPRKFKPTPSFLRKMFEINSHFHKHFLTILLTVHPHVKLHTNALAMALIIVLSNSVKGWQKGWMVN